MPQSKKDLVRDIVEMQQEMMRTFQDFLVSSQPVPSLHPDAWRPPTDVYETEELVIVRMEIPGVGPEELNIAVENETLIVQGRRTDAAREEKVHFRQMEINYGRFQRLIPLSVSVDESDVKATYTGGFLEIILKKVAARQATKISVTKKS